MTSKIFIILFLFFINLDRAFADCESQRNKAINVCDKANIKDPLKLYSQLQAFLASNKDAGAAKTAEEGKAQASTAKTQVDQYQIECAVSWKNCVSVCDSEARSYASAGDASSAQAAQDSSKYCAGEPKQNAEAAKTASMDMGQLIGGLGALLSALKGTGSESGDPCEKNSALCKTDTASQSPGATLSNNTTRQGSGETFEQGLNTSDVPQMGEAAAPSLAQGTPGIGGGGGINTAGMGGGPSRGGKGVAEINADGTPKINLASAPGGGGKNGGSVTPSNPQSPSKGSGNPVASRVSIDGDSRNNSTAALVDKAMQSRGLASENGQLGGVTAAHAFDNFQKVEKRIQNERNQLGEL